MTLYEQMAQGYLEMSEINLNITNECEQVEAEAMDTTENSFK